MSDTTIAFLTIIESEANAKIGGLLVTSERGRPIEFHCTEPVTPNRAQQILYGRTLDAYLCGDLIAPSLLGKLKTRPALVVTDVASVLIARERHEEPMVAIVKFPMGSQHLSSHEFQGFQMGSHTVVTNAKFPKDESEVIERWSTFEAWIELEEPLDRIRAAIQEAQRAAA